MAFALIPVDIVFSKGHHTIVYGTDTFYLVGAIKRRSPFFDITEAPLFRIQTPFYICIQDRHSFLLTTLSYPIPKLLCLGEYGLE